MLRMAICDNDKSFVKKMEDYTEKHYKHYFEYDAFYSAEELIAYEEKANERYDLYLLDIEMEAITGLELARRIRSINKKCAIIFMSSHNYMPNSFYVRPHNYIMKPVTEEVFVSELDIVLRDLKEEKKVFCFSQKRQILSILCDDIICILKDGRKAMLLTKDKKYIFNATMDEIWKQLDKTRFVNTQKSCIINMNYVREIKTEYVLLEGGNAIYISRDYRKALKEKFLEYRRIK